MDFQIDLPRLEASLDHILDNFDFKWNQFGFTYRPNTKIDKLYHDNVGSLWEAERDFKAELPRPKNDSVWSEFIPELKDTYFYDIFQTVPIKFGRMRVMGIEPRTCLSLHADRHDKYHIVIRTNPNVYMFFEDPDEKRTAVKIPADGFLYKTDSMIRHTVFNASKADTRYHLVFS